MNRKGEIRGKSKAFTLEEVGKIRKVLEAKENLEELCLFLVALDTMLRSIDLLNLKVSDVLKYDGGIKEKFLVIPQKTKKLGRPKRKTRNFPKVMVYLSGNTQKVLLEYIRFFEKDVDDYLFANPKSQQPLTTRTFRNIVKRWAISIGLDPKYYSGHSTRRTFSEYLDKTCGIPLQMLQDLMGHASIESTKKYTDTTEERREEIFRKNCLTG